MKRTVLAVALAVVAGCQTPPAVTNPITVAEPNFETVWAKTVDVVNDHFRIAQEDRRSGKIVSKPLPMATMFEPWHRDTRTASDRLEATLQTLRRRLTITVRPGAEGGHAIEVEVRRMIEDADSPKAATSAVAPFMADAGSHASSELTAPEAPVAGWIDRGRDVPCEQWLLAEIQQAFE